MSAICVELLPRVDRVARLIHAEFQEMPGMRLTHAQVRRLWNLSEDDCDEVLHRLSEIGCLSRDASGRYYRPGTEY